MNRPGTVKIDKVVLECKDPETLSGFYCKLLGWSKGYDTGDFIIIGSEGGNIDIGFQRNTDYSPPQWPDADGGQQMLMHIDFCVAADKHQEWVQYAIHCGAKKADFQASEDWTVMLDPEGHPFCIDPAV